jgi:mannose-1-phosphate guanylyltransferase
MSSTYVAIMAGGIGSRFWPGSRTNRPKQFLDVLGIGRSLLQMTYDRFLKVCPKENILILTNEMYRDLVKEHLPDLEDKQILGEPSRNNTAPCVTYTTYRIQAMNPDATFIVTPADAIILDEAIFVSDINNAVNFASTNDALCTLGIKPTSPHTGYGYINYADEPVATGVHKVQRFTEKPDLETAKSFLSTGNYVWNAGIFIWSVKSVIRALSANAPELYEKFESGKAHFNTETEIPFISEMYPTTPKISIDYALMEKATNVYTIPASFRWSDLGAWGALHEEYQKDENNNAVNVGEAFLYDTKNSLIRTAKDKLVVIKGLDDYIVVDDNDVLLIYPKSDEQEIKEITDTIRENGGERFL